MQPMFYCIEFPQRVDINPREDVIAIIPTSGSTGPPKGAMHTHYTGVALMETFRYVFHCLFILQ
jgi:acyl-coenzyme A synthetase/AMP-(fatty) acid ligase